jgi:hypothetical protein
MGTVCGIEQKLEVTALRQACSAHIAVISIKTSDAENKKDNSLKGNENCNIVVHGDQYCNHSKKNARIIIICFIEYNKNGYQRE